ncbi:hypothetical protein BJ508DRAFT_324714 [Ascobolus immersus RN42]|uniref:Uncharacterized protein n=1 Tax=Ascobolus immersus RN42 TaxID=1160509 RepID=A0A3N4IAK6_ASCIM|nr:hypothetical protein BJ508DRAFT_324714 [Ascobolus immersus RN42]
MSATQGFAVVCSASRLNPMLRMMPIEIVHDKEEMCFEFASDANAYARWWALHSIIVDGRFTLDGIDLESLDAAALGFKTDKAYLKSLAQENILHYENENQLLSFEVTVRIEDSSAAPTTSSDAARYYAKDVKVVDKTVGQDGTAFVDRPAITESTLACVRRLQERGPVGAEPAAETDANTGGIKESGIGSARIEDTNAGESAVEKPVTEKEIDVLSDGCSKMSIDSPSADEKIPEEPDYISKLKEYINMGLGIDLSKDTVVQAHLAAVESEIQMLRKENRKLKESAEDYESAWEHLRKERAKLTKKQQEFRAARRKHKDALNLASKTWADEAAMIED